MIADAHLHFFSKGVLAFFARQVDSLKEASDPAAAAAAELGIEPPPADPEALAARWVAEMDKNGVGRAALFGSAPGESTSVSRAGKAFPDRFVPFQMLNPRAADLPAVLRELPERGIRGVLLFPAMHGYYPDEVACRPIYEAARENHLTVFVHLGRLRIAIRERLGIRTPLDPTFGIPERLKAPLREFADVNFIVPHFGCGTLPELLTSMAGARNLYVDTSSSNSWMADTPPFTSLETVFRAVLESKVFGPERILFGTDSTVFPRGFRKDVYEQQVAALGAIGAPAADQKAIFSGNFDRLFA